MPDSSDVSPRVAEFSDLFGEILHQSRYYRGAAVLLVLINVFLLLIVFVQASQPAPAPIVVRVDEVGRAEVVDYDPARAIADQNDPTVLYFLNSFVHNYYRRNRALGSEPWQRSLHFMAPDVYNAVVAAERQSQDLAMFLADPRAPDQSVENLVVRIIPQPQPPYQAEIRYDLVSAVAGQPTSSVAYTLTLQFVFVSAVPAETRLINPLGLLVTYMDAQQAIPSPL